MSVEIPIVPSAFPQLVGRVVESDGCWLWVGDRKPSVLRGPKGRKHRNFVTPVYFVRFACGLTRTGKAQAPACGYSNCVNPAHWQAKPKRRKQRQYVPRKLTTEIAATIRREYRTLCRHILTDHGSKAKARAAVRHGGDRRIREFFDRMVERYQLGRSTVRHAAYGTRGGTKYQPRQDEPDGVSNS